MKKIFVLQIIILFFCSNNYAQIKYFNNFNTLKLTPFNTEKVQNLKVKCNYKNEKLIEIEFENLKGKKLLSSDIIYFNGKPFFITKYKNYDDYILLSYIKDDKLMNIRFIKKKNCLETQGFYFLNSKSEKDWRNYNFKIHSKNYSSMIEFIKKDLNKLVISEDFHFTEYFNYVDNRFFEYSFTQYFNKRKDGSYNKGYPACRKKIRSFAGCLFLDSILYEMNYFTDILLIDSTKK